MSECSALIGYIHISFKFVVKTVECGLIELKAFTYNHSGILSVWRFFFSETCASDINLCSMLVSF